MTGSISQGRDKSKSLQMTGRPLMTPDELKIMPKDTFIVTRTGVKPMKTKLKLFFEWGIELNETYPMRQAVVRKVHYANKKTIEEAIAKNTVCPKILSNSPSNAQCRNKISRYATYRKP